MRILAIVFALFFAAPVAAQDREVSTVISEQLDALQARQLPLAFSYASPMIQRLFQTPDNFGQMVEMGYPMVWDHGEARFLDSKTLGDAGEVVMQKVMLRDLTGGLHILEYQMIKLPQGWRINGVTLLNPPQVGA